MAKKTGKGFEIAAILTSTTLVPESELKFINGFGYNIYHFNIYRFLDGKPYPVAHSYFMQNMYAADFAWNAFRKEHKTLISDYSELDVLKNKKIFVTVDLDVLDPSVMPGTGTPESGGMQFNELMGWFEYLKNFDIIGADVVELAPDYDTSGVSTAVATKVIRELLMIMSPLKK